MKVNTKMTQTRDRMEVANCVGAGTLSDANHGEQRLILKVSEANVVPAPMWPYNAHYLKISS